MNELINPTAFPFTHVIPSSLPNMPPTVEHSTGMTLVDYLAAHVCIDISEDVPRWYCTEFAASNNMVYIDQSHTMLDQESQQPLDRSIWEVELVARYRYEVAVSMLRVREVLHRQEPPKETEKPSPIIVR